MDRRRLIELLKNGVRYPAGRHHFLSWRLFEITVRPSRVVELDEYEGFSTRRPLSLKHPCCVHSRPGNRMFHLGGSFLRRGRVLERPGTGWGRLLVNGDKNS